ncbi:MAG: L-aspartate oxidase [bacterium]
MKFSTSPIIIIGSGIAGLYAAIKLAENNKNKQILFVTKSTLRESNSRYAQGGIVGVLNENILDSIDLHVNDTVKAGAGLTDIEVARFISQDSSTAINDLIKYGVEFDKDFDNKIAFTLEAAHSVRRILHSGGDSTGKNIELTLSKLVESISNINIRQKTQVIDLLIDSNNICRGIIAFNTENNEYEAVFSSVVIIATGGVGQIYSNTTNPKIATGDGIALAYRANAIIQDMEFVQFHPTALTVKENQAKFLISESVRGEGARLKNFKGELFTFNYDKRGDLAPRDIVTRAVFFEMKNFNLPHVLLDTSLIESNKLKQRFPNIVKACEDNDIDILNKNIPVSPAAHYIMGGIKISVNGKTSIPGLFAIGEASCVSLHGANRLASNSLLECVVIPGEMAKYINIENIQPFISEDSRIKYLISQYDNNSANSSSKKICDLSFFLNQLKEIMWDNVGIIRNEKCLNKALKIINKLKLEFNKEYKCNNIEEYEFRNLLTIAELITKSAIARKESRGAHFREDYPKTAETSYHSYSRKEEITVKNALSFT